MYGARQVGKTYILKDNSTQKVDFVVQANSRILPIEVKAEDNVKSKSLHAFICKDFASYHLKGVRFSMLGFQSQEWMENIPLYAIESYPNFALSTSFPFLYQQFNDSDLRYCVLQILFILIFCMISSCILAVRKCRQLFAKIMLYSGFSVYYKCAFQKAIIDYQLLTCWIYSKKGQFFIDRGKVGLTT